MPTGYTYKVVEGTMSEFADYALGCARAFGALIDLRDEPNDVPIPDEIKPSPYHQDRLAEAKLDLAAWDLMNDVARRTKLDTVFEVSLTYFQEWRVKRNLEDERLLAMRTKVQSWVPPTPDHTEMKKFMIEQLEISLNGESKYFDTAPVKEDFETWETEYRESILKDIAYHEKGWNEEIKRTAERNGWIKALKNSLTETSKNNFPA